MYMHCTYLHHGIMGFIKLSDSSKGVFKGGGFRGFKPPPPEIFRFFLKSEGKEIESKRKKRDVGGGGGGGYLLTYFWG